MTERITGRLPELVEPPTDYREPHWVAAVPAKALAQPNLPAVGPKGESLCPCCGRDVHHVLILGRLPLEALRCHYCHQAISWVGWEQHVIAVLKARLTADLPPEDAAAAVADWALHDDEDDEDDEEAPCICCGEYCDPDRDSGYCPDCARQGCGPH